LLIVILALFAYTATFNFGRAVEKDQEMEARMGFFVSIIVWTIVLVAALSGEG
jgi:hypothetical protein